MARKIRTEKVGDKSVFLIRILRVSAVRSSGFLYLFASMQGTPGFAHSEERPGRAV